MGEAGLKFTPSLVELEEALFWVGSGRTAAGTNSGRHGLGHAPSWLDH